MTGVTKAVKKRVTKSSDTKPVRKKNAAPKTNATLTTCHITFPFSITRSELPAFRGAINRAVEELKDVFKKAGIATDLFHNHEDAESDRVHQRLPVITYQLVRDNGDGQPQPGCFFPALTGSGEGVKALQLLANNMPPRLTIYRRQFTEYALYKWLALNPDNYTRYKSDLRFTARVQLLETILRKNIIGWYAAAGHTLDENTFKLFLTEITAITHDGTELKGRRMFVFDCCFATNMPLPPQMAVGNGTAWGYGKIRPLHSSTTHAAALKGMEVL